MSSTGKSRTHDRRFLVAGALIALLAVAYLMVWRPRSTNLADLRAERAALEVSAPIVPGKAGTATAGNRATPPATADDPEREGRVAAAVPAGPQLSNLLRSLETASGAAGLESAAVTVDEPTVGTSGTETVGIGVTAEATQDVAYDYLARLAALDRLVVIDTFELQGTSLTLAARAFSIDA